MNSKINRKKLVKALFSVPRTQLVLLPYYARMVSVLNKCMKDIGPQLVSMLEVMMMMILHDDRLLWS